MKLGTKPKKGEAMPAMAESPKIRYPYFTLDDALVGKASDQLFDGELPSIGEEFTATVRFKVTGTRADNYGKSISLDVMEISDTEKQTPEEEPEEEETDAEKSEEKEEGNPAISRMRKAKRA